ncbi:hypothetical protein MKW98_018875 [Papaver atlanticum]|uniref:Transposase Tnp1/En/Spm-like domain-containing protein n=1 Tax=Papaver atlanticum TaxID=357466 RepID=A0AAD4TFV7_9MAGN|nr:hypothetical protein MKW98_018875 [Papaver atlanticum]
MRSKRLELKESLKQQKPSTTNRQQALKKHNPSTTKRQEALENQRLSTTKPCSASVNSGRLANEIVTDAVDERLKVVPPEKQKLAATNQCFAFVDEFVSDAVDERLDAVALEKQSSSATKPFSAFINSRREKQNVTDAVGERLNVIALEKQRSLTIKPCSAFVSCSRENEIVTDPVDVRLNVVDGGSDIKDEDAGTLDSCSDIRDGDAEILGDEDLQIVEDQSLPTNSDEDANVLDADGDRYEQIVQDQSLPTYSDEDADILDADGNGEMQIVEDQSLPTNFENLSSKRKREMVRRQVTDPHSESNNVNCTSMPSGKRIPIIFDKYGRPCDVGSEEFASDIGKIVRVHCPPAIESWTKVPNSMKENIWKDVIVKYVVPEIYKPNILSRASKSYKNWKRQLRVELDKHETVAERKMNLPWRLIKKREDWETFVDFCNTDEDKKRRAAGKKARESVEFIQSCGRKGIYRKIYELEKESPIGEVNRAAIFVETHFSKTINDPESSSISDTKLKLIKELVETNPDGQKDIDNDAVALVCGRDTRGVVRGMGGGVSRTKVLRAASVETLRKAQQENKSLQSDIHLPNHTSAPSNQSASHIQNCTSTLSNQSASQMPAKNYVSPCPNSQINNSGSNIVNEKNTVRKSQSSRIISGSVYKYRHEFPESWFIQGKQRVDSKTTDWFFYPPTTNSQGSGDENRSQKKARKIEIRSRKEARKYLLEEEKKAKELAPEASNLLGHSRLVSDVPNSPARSRLAPPVSNSPACSRLPPPMSNLPVHSHLAPSVSNLPARLSCLAPPACNLPATSCLIKNFKGRTIALGSINTADPPAEHVYSLIIEEIFDRNAELFDKDGRLGDIMIGGVINWPKACVESNFPASSCFITNFKRRIIAVGSLNTADQLMEHVYGIVVKEIYDKEAELFDEDGKLGDVIIGGVINWPKACVKPCRQ